MNEYRQRTRQRELDNENYQLYVQASPRLSLGGVLEYGIYVCEYGRYVSGPEA